MTTPTDDVLLLPNVGAEEGPEAGRHPAAREVARLWRLLFPAAQRAGGAEPADPPAWPSALGARPPGAAFAFLDAPGCAAAWLNTDEAEREAARAGRALLGAPPDAVRRVHDKAFTHRAALEAGLVPGVLRDLVEVLEPESLRDADAAIARLEAHLARWPDWARRSFALKPRLGGSGRGRVAGVDGRVDTQAVRGALPRLARRGGAILEPWLERREDLSAQLYVSPDGGPVLLGTTEQVLTPAGLYRGHRGEVDSRGRIHAATPHDEAIRPAAAEIALAAAGQGYSGPCGVDAFAFATPEGGVVLRPVCEFNARFTLGTLVVGLIKRARRALRSGIGMAPDRRRAFYFALDAPPEGWPEPGPGLQLIPLWEDALPMRPALLVAEDRARIDRALGG